jgi:ABC-type uncharacterized transport system substrate-binding protein
MKKCKFLVPIVVVAALMVPLVALAEHGTGPVTKKDGRKWRVSYLEGGDYINYPLNLRAIVEGLARLGWVEPLEVPKFKGDDTGEMWSWLAKNAKSKSLEFAPDAYWSADWDDEKRKKLKGEVIARLREKKDVDLMIAMGTWAGQDLANNEHSVPTMVVSTSDPIKSKIIVSAEDSGYDHLHAKVDPERYANQVRLFYEVVGFGRLGIVYEDSVDGRTYAAIEDVQKVAKELGFQLVKCEAPFSGISVGEATAGVIKCHQELASKVDALFLTVHRGVVCEAMPEIMAPLLANDLPTWSQRGSGEVREGVLMSISRADFGEIGLFHAQVMDHVFNGDKPRDLGQIFQDPKAIAINLETAQKIEYDPSFDILAAADEIFEETETVCK